MAIWRTIMGMASVVMMMGCGSSSREVMVQGEVIVAPEIQVQGPIQLRFIDLLDSDNLDQRETIQTVYLNNLGEFSQTLQVEGDAMLIVALHDVDHDGQCSEGELWSAVQISSLEVPQRFRLRLAAHPCSANTF
jgi:hypothetical protein